MDRFRNILDGWRKFQDPRMQQLLGAVERYLDSGDPAAMKLIVAAPTQTWMVPQMLSALSKPDALDDLDRRLLRLVAACDHGEHLIGWIGSARDSGLGDDAFPKAIAELSALGFTLEQLESLALAGAPWACD